MSVAEELLQGLGLLLRVDARYAAYFRESLLGGLMVFFSGDISPLPGMSVKHKYFDYTTVAGILEDMLRLAHI